MDAYEGFSERYDFSFGTLDDHNAQLAETFRQLFSQNDIHTVLDCACGTGRHLPLFHSLGCDVTGSDCSAAMLEEARQNLLGQGLEIPLHLADFRQLPGSFDHEFDAVVCLNAIGFIPGEEGFLQAFKSMAQVLRPGGILVLTTGLSDRQWLERPRFILNASRPGFARIFVIDYLEDRAQYHILDLFQNDQASELKVWSADMYPLLQDDLERLLLEAGFRRIHCYAGFCFSPYDKGFSNHLVTVASRS